MHLPQGEQRRDWLVIVAGRDLWAAERDQHLGGGRCCGFENVQSSCGVRTMSKETEIDSMW